MSTAPSVGICNFCGQEQNRSAMSRHVTACPGRPRGEQERLAIVVEGMDHRAYWLHLDVHPEATLADLDAFLRDIWLECCGHLSGFRIGDREYDSSGDPEGMDACVADALPPGARAEYVYDYGSSTRLELHANQPRLGGEMPEPVMVAARNKAPVIRCDDCTKAATGLCRACGGAVCPSHAAGHDCGPGRLAPVANSPRAGVCAYTG